MFLGPSRWQRWRAWPFSPSGWSWSSSTSTDSSLWGGALRLVEQFSFSDVSRCWSQVCQCQVKMQLKPKSLTIILLTPTESELKHSGRASWLIEQQFEGIESSCDMKFCGCFSKVSIPNFMTTLLSISYLVLGVHLDCKPRPYGTWASRLHEAFIIWSGAGMSLQVKTWPPILISLKWVVSN